MKNWAVLWAFAFGLGSFLYPLGHDQSVHAYIAREWLARGAMPYRDTFDHKTPGIFFVHALSRVLFGSRAWAIRPIEILTVIVLGVLVAQLLESKRRWLVVPMVSFVYYGFFTFLDTAQPELWATTFAIGALLATRRRRAGIAGLLAGAAIMMKPPIAAFVVWAFVVLPAWSSRAVFVASFGIVPLVTASYFASRHALGAMWEILVGANRSYVGEGWGRASPLRLLDAVADSFGALHPASTIGVMAALAVFVLHRRRRWSDARLGLALGATGALAVVLQMRFHAYHAVPLVPALGVLLVVFVDVVAARVPKRFAMLAPVAIVAAAYPLAGRRATGFWNATSGMLTRHEPTFASAGGHSYDYADSVRLADWLRAHSSESDRIVVRGFHAEVYLLADRRYDGRFFWSGSYAGSFRNYAGAAAWREEDKRALETTAPRYVIDSSDPGCQSSRERFDGTGYDERVHVGRWTVWERSRQRVLPDGLAGVSARGSLSPPL